MPPPEVFISYRSTPRSKALADGLSGILKGRQVDSFLDTEVIKAGDAFETRILDHIRTASVVVVFFDDEISSWLHFEAACAHFDRKLLPVAVGGAVVPKPYDQLQHEAIGHEGDGASEPFLDKVADQVMARLGRDGPGASTTRYVTRANEVFAWGVWVLLTVAAAAAIPIGDLTPFRYLIRTYVILGAVLLGGQFFLSLGFARAVASRSFREREYGFEAVEKLFWVWIAAAFLHPVLGVLMIWLSEFRTVMPSWMILAFAAYAAEVAFFGVGYLVARAARELDRNRRPTRAVMIRRLTANALFVLGLFAGATVVVFMVANAPTQWLGSG